MMHRQSPSPVRTDTASSYWAPARVSARDFFRFPRAEQPTPFASHVYLGESHRHLTRTLGAPHALIGASGRQRQAVIHAHPHVVSGNRVIHSRALLDCVHEFLSRLDRSFTG